ncbi:PAS domain-containing sensor histidine kinase [Pilimelia columellifera]|uniref:histidine kinase n=1 Tax=Pilimelia columellifera subsp. columellifera TaxID=706583 RepID=A0ABP6AF12_9ACTN
MRRFPGVRQPTTWLSLLSGLIVLALTGGALALWRSGEGTGRRYRALAELGTPPPEAAVAVFVAGIALLLALGAPGRLRRAVVIALGAGVALVGTLGILEHLGPARPSALAGLIREAAVTGAPEPKPMSAASGCAIALVGLALVIPPLVNARDPDAMWPHTFAPAAATIAGVTLLAYVIGETSVPALGALITMTPLTAVSILMFTVGIIWAHPAHGLLRPLRSGGPGATLSRRVGPALLLLPVGVAVVSGAVIQAGWGEPALTISLATAAFVLVLMVVLGGTARVLDRADDQQRTLVEALSAERDFSGTLLRSMSEAVLVHDRDLKVIDVNPSGCRLLGRERDQLIGQRPPYPWEDQTPRTPGANQTRHIVRPDGAQVPVLAMTSPVLDDRSRPRAYVGTYVDITDHRQAEESLARHAAQLEAANQQLQLRHEELAEAAHFKGDLMSIMSHEVSQPLSSVSSLSELLNTEWDQLDEGIRQDLASKIDRNTRRLTNMINDMLLLFRLDAGVVSARRAAVPISEVVDAVAATLPAGVALDTRVDPNLCALVDRAHLNQVIKNLVNNAVSYGAPPFELATDVRADGVVLTVRDHGPGVPPEDRARLFDRIAHSRGADGRRTGSGLGLFIVRHLVELNGGTIWYEDAEPTGARLVVRLAPTAALGTVPLDGRASAAASTAGAVNPAAGSPAWTERDSDRRADVRTPAPEHPPAEHPASSSS